MKSQIEFFVTGGHSQVRVVANVVAFIKAVLFASDDLYRSAGDEKTVHPANSVFTLESPDSLLGVFYIFQGISLYQLFDKKSCRRFDQMLQSSSAGSFVKKLVQ